MGTKGGVSIYKKEKTCKSLRSPVTVTVCEFVVGQKTYIRPFDCLASWSTIVLKLK